VGSTRRTIEKRQVEKGFNALFTFTKYMTRADAQAIEGHAHSVADKYYKRAPVQGGITKRQGDLPNRTGEWWYGKPSKGFIALMMMAITTGYNKRFNTALEQHPYYKGAVASLKKSPK
tara:strand:- start:326 stop:679 length:354 start_codon:yes stop_codon:yes gene_type:complete